MQADLRETKDGMVAIDIEGCSLAERVLLSHLAEGHQGIICVGRFGDGVDKGKGCRILVVNKSEDRSSRRKR